MSAEAMKVNELLEEAASFCQRKADEIRAFVNGEIRDPAFLVDVEAAAIDLRDVADEIRELKVEEED